MPITTLDLRGVRCPLPIVRLNTTIRTIEPGQQLGFVADDPAFPLDVQAWGRRTGHAVTLDPPDAGCVRGTVTRVA